MIKKKISIIGQGYVGLPISLLLSKNSQQVSAFDINTKLINKFKNGSYGLLCENEEDVVKLYLSQYKKRNLEFTDILSESDIYVVCVPTPITNQNKPDLKHVYSAVSGICKFLKKDDLIIIESTIAIGSIDKIQKLILKKSKIKNLKYHIAYCPERVLPGNALNEIIKNDRVVGGINKKSQTLAKNFYKIFVKGSINATSVGVAEFTKLSENAFRDINIAFANELSILCQKNNVNYNEVIKYANKHPRVNILKPGIGVGGHCIPIDPWFLIENYKKDFSIIKNSRLVNINKSIQISKNIINILNSNKAIKKNDSILFLGLSYKENIGDVRESPAIKIINYVSKKINQKIFVNDPYVKDNIFYDKKNITQCNLSRVIKKSKFIVILVGHSDYKNLHKLLSKQQIIYDACDYF